MRKLIMKTGIGGLVRAINCGSPIQTDTTRELLSTNTDTCYQKTGEKANQPLSKLSHQLIF